MKTSSSSDFDRAGVGSGETRLQTSAQPVSELEQAYTAMKRSVRNWGLLILIFSIIYMLPEQAYKPYFLVLIMLSVLAIFFRSSLMWVVIAVYMFTETVTQILVGAGWQFLLLSTIILMVCLVNYGRYCGVERQYRQSALTGGTGGPLPIDSIGRRLGLLAVGFGWLGPAAGFTLLMFALLIGVDPTVQGGIFNVAGNSVMEAITLGLSFGIASLLTGTHHRLLAIAGIIPGLLVWIFEMYSWLYLE